MQGFMNKKADEKTVFINDTNKLQTRSVKSSEGEDMPRFKARQIEAMNFQADLQAVLMALLSQYASISVGRPHRLSHLTKQFIKIKKITFNGQSDVVDVLQYIQTRAKDQAQYEFKVGNTTKKTAKRRIQPTKRREAMRFLQDLLMEFGFFIEIETETIDGYEGEVKIYYNGQLLLNSTQIKTVGSEINKNVASLLRNEATVVLDSTNIGLSFF